MASKVHETKDIDVNKIIYTPVKKNKNGVHFCYVAMDNNKKSLIFQSPQMMIKKLSKNVNDIYSISFYIPDTLVDFIHALEEKFQKDHGNSEYKFRTSLNQKEFSCRIGTLHDITLFDHRKKMYDEPEDILRLLKPNTCVQSIIECVGIWYYDQEYGITWVVDQIKLLLHKEYMFDDSNESEIDPQSFEDWNAIDLVEKNSQSDMSIHL
jgi:hypothetical protein